MSQARRWCFTMFFEDPADLPTSLPLSATFLVFGWELCPTTKRPHAQGYVEWSNPKMLGGCRKVLEANWTIARGDQKQNIKYCTKDGDWVEFGQRAMPGTRSDLLRVKELVDGGAKRDRLYDEVFSIYGRAERFVNNYIAFRSPPRTVKPTVLLFVGPSGIGKSRTAATLCSYLGSVYTVPLTKGSGLYFDRYEQQDVLFLDEMDGARCSPTFFNSLCDWNEFTVPVHGSGNIQFTSRYIIICSNYLPKYWWKKRSSLQLVQTTRRIDSIVPMIARSAAAPFLGAPVSSSANLVEAHLYTVDLCPPQPNPPLPEVSKSKSKKQKLCK